MTDATTLPPIDRPGLLLVEDDPVLREALADALARRGFDVCAAHDAASAARLLQAHRPRHALVDLGLPDMSGLRLLTELKLLDAGLRVVVLTGHAQVGTVVSAMRAGASDYLVKPVPPDEIVAALSAQAPRLELPPAPAPAAAPALPLSVERLAWEHIQRVLADCNGCVSAAARALKMHRRTLQRKLGKNPPRT